MNNKVTSQKAGRDTRTYILQKALTCVRMLDTYNLSYVVTSKKNA